MESAVCYYSIDFENFLDSKWIDLCFYFLNELSSIYFIFNDLFILFLDF